LKATKIKEFVFFQQLFWLRNFQVIEEKSVADLKLVLNPFKVCTNPIQDMLVLVMNNSYLGSTAKIDLFDSTGKFIS
jgi:hypothetical protein